MSQDPSVSLPVLKSRTKDDPSHQNTKISKVIPWTAKVYLAVTNQPTISRAIISEIKFASSVNQRLLCALGISISNVNIVVWFKTEFT